MPDAEAAELKPARPSVFLSYASEDRQAARALRDAISVHGLDVWYDENELSGGVAWDQKIRRQIRECDYFMPIVSAQTERRHEGYFRREWRMAVERTLDMADDHPFLLPVTIDDTDQAVARVPEKFLTVQWLRVPGGQATPGLELLCRRMVSGSLKVAGPAPKSRPATPQARAAAPEPAATPEPSPVPPPDTASPPFPVERDGQKARFWVEVAAWLARSAWKWYKRLPRWMRIIVVVWVFIALMKQCESSPSRHRSADVTPAEVEKLKAIAKNYQDTHDNSALGTLGAEIAKEIAKDQGVAADDGEESAAASPLLAIAFTAPTGDASAAKLADSAFAMTYGRIAISHRGQVGLSREPPATPTVAAAVKTGKAVHSKYVLGGDVESVGGTQTLKVRIIRVSDASVIWSSNYGATDADPAKIAAEVDAHIPALDSD